MHDPDTFAPTPALNSTAEPPPIAKLLSTFEKESEVAFKGECYLVRDNGSVFRRRRPNAKGRRLDEVWTFGTLNSHSGYFEIAGHVVHRIVATAFHGPSPTDGHVVDHIDTNRLNNRPDNLRWVTRLENILLNPITRARIEIAYGSLEAFFANPGASFIPNWDWMKVVTKEEAQESQKRLLAWAEIGQAGRGGSLGEWLYRPQPQNSPSATEKVDAVIEPELLDTPSLTAGAVQRKWRTPTEFPQCPETVSPDAIKTYLERLVAGAVFASNRYGENTVTEAAIGPSSVLSVVCMTPSEIKNWSHARVYLESDTIVHESGGMFFTQEGAMKAHCKSIGAPFDAYNGSIDDFC